jgi:hypothetical protein
MVEDNLFFIIAHKYYRNYKNYIKDYVNNIKEFYPNANIIVVDNNSTHDNPCFENLKEEGVIILENNSICKFELGAYKVAIDYLKVNNLIRSDTYFIFTQDNFIIKNKYDFNTLKMNNVNACPIVTWVNDWEFFTICKSILESVGLFNNLEKVNFCWCNSFIINGDKLLEFYDFIKNIVITTRVESMASERYLSRIFWEINDNQNFDIDGNIDDLDYYCHSVDITDNVSNFFCKLSQQKNEKTLEI